MSQSLGAVAQGAITAQDKVFIEEWENISTPIHSIIKFDVQGAEQHHIIEGPRHFQLSTAERKVTQNRILQKKDDPFLNGAFRPVIVPDSVNIESNPNALSEAEIKSILVSSPVAWEEWMKVIDSPDTIARMMAIADQDENITYRRVKQLSELLAAVRPQTQIRNKDRAAFDAMSGTPA